jgi:hypothetical protein
LLVHFPYTKEIKTRLEMTSAAMTQLNAIWKPNISFPMKIKLYKLLILSIFLSGCESWTLAADISVGFKLLKINVIEGFSKSLI